MNEFWRDFKSLCLLFIIGAFWSISLFTSEQVASASTGATGSISGYAFNDLSGNNYKDVGETGIAGITFTLWSNGTALSTATTDSTGLYQFLNLPAASYQVVAPVSGAGYVLQSTSSLQVYLGTSQNDAPENFAFRAATSGPCLVSIMVETDCNDGSIDPPVSGVLVTINGTDVNGNHVTATGTTLADGTVNFPNLPCGVYSISVPTVAGGELLVGPSTATVTLNSNGANGCIYFEYTGVTVQGNLFESTDGTCVCPDVTNVNLAGITVTLLDSLGNTVSTTTTDATGHYQFFNCLPAGTYTVSVPASTTVGGVTVTTSRSSQSTGAIAAGGSAKVDFCYKPPTSCNVSFKACAKCIDITPNPLLAGVTISLTGTDSAGNHVSLTSVTDINGAVNFANLVCGTYSVSAPSVANGESLVSAPTVSLALNTNGGIGSASFSYTGVVIQGNLFESTNGTCTYPDSTDVNLGGITVTLLNSSGATVATTTTDTTGHYRFSGCLPAGTYTVSVPSSTTVGGVTVVTSTPTQSTGSVAAGGSSTLNFCYKPSPCLVSITSVAKCIDITPNPAAIGVTITLTGTTSLGDHVSVPAVTNSSGVVSFPNLACGSYTVTAPTISNGELLVGASSVPLTLNSNGASGTATFTYTGIVIQGNLFESTNGTCAYPDSTDVNLGGITVTLLNSSGGTVATTTTDVNGHYRFSGCLPAGTYTVSVPNSTTVGGVTVVTSTPTQSTGSVAAGGSSTLNFCYKPPTTPNIGLTKTASVSTITSANTPVTFTYVVTNTGTVPLTNVVVTDDNGTPGYTGDDFIVGTVASLGAGASQTFTQTIYPTLPMCVSSSITSNPVGTLQTQILPNGDVKVTFRQSRSVNDNTYGTNASAGWGTKGHKFSDLVGSDNAEFLFKNGAGTTVLDAHIDYISQSSAFPSGYGTLGATGGDGKIVTGSASSVVSVNTTFSDDLNQSPAFYGYTTNSPAPEASFPTWDYVDGYTVVVAGSAFGPSGFGGVSIPFVHNSPSELSQDQISPVPCNMPLTNTAVVTALAGSTTVTATATATIQVNISGGTTGGTCTSNSIKSNFNGTAIAAGNYIWFNSVFKATKVSPGPTTIHFTNQSVALVGAGVNTTVPVPDADVTFTSAVTTPTTTWDGTKWVTMVPVTYTGNVFLSGAAYLVPAGGLPGGIGSVTWSGFSSSANSSVTGSWQWAAAVYKSGFFSGGYPGLGVLPTDSGGHAGTPVKQESNVIGGARGGGGSNFTGSYSGTGTLSICKSST